MIKSRRQVIGLLAISGCVLSNLVVGNLKTSRTVKKEKLEENYSPLPQAVIDGVKSFVFFLGHPHSGHSIVGSVLDSHPHIVMAHEEHVFNRKYPMHCNKSCMFNNLWKNSYESCHGRGLRTEEADSKGYSLAIKGLYQGVYKSYIDVIGDKSGGGSAKLLKDIPKQWESVYKKLKSVVGVPVKAIHVIRNPYDNIASVILYTLSNREQSQNVTITNLKSGNNNDYEISLTIINHKITEYFTIYQAIEDAKKKYNLDVLEMHGIDLITQPKKIIMELFEFLNVDCSDHFLAVCEEQVYTKESKSRYKIKWEDEHLSIIQENIQKFGNLRRYNLDS
ncbi:uncharacterized protein [Dysidea avara]|uniref:uncharacterized protein n=1 Tax=Dysidea avara TaxID=196820 RepID=UPI0033223783